MPPVVGRRRSRAIFPLRHGFGPGAGSRSWSYQSRTIFPRTRVGAGGKFYSELDPDLLSLPGTGAGSEPSEISRLCICAVRGNIRDYLKGSHDALRSPFAISAEV